MDNYKQVDALSNLRTYLKSENAIYLVTMAGRSSYDDANRFTMYQCIYIQWEVASETREIKIPINFTNPKDRIYIYEDYLLNIKEAIDSYQEVLQNFEKYIEEYRNDSSRRVYNLG
jgi:hypothetical protein